MVNNNESLGYASPRNEYDFSKDPAVDRATRDLEKYFKEHKREIFYLKQIQLIFERKYFHWITYNALKNLEGEIVNHETVKTETGEIKFIFNKGARYRRNEIKNKRKIIEEYSKENIARACGELADTLFQLGFAKKGFRLSGEDISEYKEKQWGKTKHNLDFIMEKDSIAYGCEVKNTFDYIDQDEMLQKLDMCEYLAVRPLFIMRFAPKNYIDTIRKRGGFTLLFETKIFPLGMESLVEQIQRELRMPVIISKGIPDGILDRFINKGHNKNCEFYKNSQRAP